MLDDIVGRESFRFLGAESYSEEGVDNKWDSFLLAETPSGKDGLVLVVLKPSNLSLHNDWLVTFFSNDVAIGVRI